jgi:hypothetical protein
MRALMRLLAGYIGPSLSLSMASLVWRVFALRVRWAFQLLALDIARLQREGVITASNVSTCLRTNRSSASSAVSASTSVLNAYSKTLLSPGLAVIHSPAVAMSRALGLRVLLLSLMVPPGLGGAIAARLVMVSAAHASSFSRATQASSAR